MENPTTTIFVNGGLELLQIVSEPDIEQYANKDVGPSKGVDCEILPRLEMRTTSISYKRVETSP